MGEIDGTSYVRVDIREGKAVVSDVLPSGEFVTNYVYEEDGARRSTGGDICTKRKSFG